MALIKCPECGNEISSSAKMCPHCGYPFKFNLKEKEVITCNFPQPIDSSWTKKWKSKATTIKLLWTFIFILSLGFLAFCILMYFKNNELTDYIWLILCFISGLLALICFVIWLSCLIVCKARIKNHDGYTVLVYTGFFKRFLVIENNIQDSGVINRFLSGHLPNKKSVYAAISFWDSSVNIVFGESENINLK